MAKKNSKSKMKKGSKKKKCALDGGQTATLSRKKVSKAKMERSGFVSASKIKGEEITKEAKGRISKEEERERLRKKPIEYYIKEASALLASDVRLSPSEEDIAAVAESLQKFEKYPKTKDFIHGRLGSILANQESIDEVVEAAEFYSSESMVNALSKLEKSPFAVKDEFVIALDNLHSSTNSTEVIDLVIEFVKDPKKGIEIGELIGDFAGKLAESGEGRLLSAFGEYEIEEILVKECELISKFKASPSTAVKIAEGLVEIAGHYNNSKSEQKEYKKDLLNVFKKISVAKTPEEALKITKKLVSEEAHDGLY